MHKEAEPGADLTCLDMELQQMSVFASQRRLCIVAALVKVVGQVQEGLYKLAKPLSTMAAIAPASTVRITKLIFVSKYHELIVAGRPGPGVRPLLLLCDNNCAAPAHRLQLQGAALSGNMELNNLAGL